MKTDEILNSIYSLVAKIKNFSVKIITRNSVFEKDLLMTNDEIRILIRLIEKVCFVVIENDEINKLKTVENLLFLIQEKKETREYHLFTGIVDKWGILLNTPDLNKSCPEEFRQENNAWRKYATKMVELGCEVSNWKFKSDNTEVQKRQKKVLRALMRSTAYFIPQNEQMKDVVAWMLSEMLSEIPEYK